MFEHTHIERSKFLRKSKKYIFRFFCKILIFSVLKNFGEGGLKIYTFRHVIGCLVFFAHVQNWENLYLIKLNIL